MAGSFDKFGCPRRREDYRLSVFHVKRRLRKAEAHSAP